MSRPRATAAGPPLRQIDSRPMPRCLRLALTLALALPALVLAACGGGDNDRDTKNAYVREVNAAQIEFASTVTTASQQITPKSSSSQDRRTLRRFQTAIDDVVAKLRRIDVPSSVRAEHARLVEAMSAFGTEIRRAVSALRNPDRRQLSRAQRAIAESTQMVNARIDRAIAAINAKLGAT